MNKLFKNNNYYSKNYFSGRNTFILIRYQRQCNHLGRGKFTKVLLKILGIS